MGVLPMSGGEQSALTGAQGIGCSVSAWLTEPEARLLGSMVDPGQVVEPAVWCELEEAHAGAHHALGQVSGEDWWWLRWDGEQRRELVNLPACEGRSDATDAGEELCALPAGHEGTHSFTRPT